MTLTELQERNYAAQIKRGKITEDTTVGDCIDDLAGEVLELFDESPGTLKFIEEAADVLLNLFTVCKMADINTNELILECNRKCLINEKRPD